jgi:hypothetical protein
MSIVPYVHPGLDRQDGFTPLITGARIELRLLTEQRGAPRCGAPLCVEPKSGAEVAAALFALIDRNRAH